MAEAVLHSGSSVTARRVFEQGHEIFVLPDSVGNPGSKGPRWSVKQGATLVTKPGEILENL